MRGPFLTARWEDLVLLNYRCPRELLEPLVPQGTELDLWKGEPLVSLVGFLFRDTRLAGLRIPFHHTFEEVNLRFYVRRTLPGGEVRRAVVFVRELVPRAAIAAIARWTYNEPYLAVPMAHQSSLQQDTGGTVEYSWSYRDAPLVLAATVSGAPALPLPGSDAEFITEHYWGYTRQRDGSTIEYRVEHPQWPTWEATAAYFSGDGRALYGSAFGEILGGRPHSVFVAAGSEIAVGLGSMRAGGMSVDKGAVFRGLHQRDAAFIIPNPWDIGSARILEHLGFEALATTSMGFAFSQGKLDTAVGRNAMLAHVPAISHRRPPFLSTPIWKMATAIRRKRLPKLFGWPLLPVWSVGPSKMPRDVWAIRSTNADL